MDLRRLGYFIAVAEEANVGRAARRLRMSQPPLSQRIRELEADLGCALFVRTSRGMELTEPGRVLLVEARALLASAEQARERVRRAAGERVLRVGVLGPGESALSFPAARAFALRCPDTAVRLHQGDLRDPLVGLTTGQVDVAITYGPFGETGLATRTVHEDRCHAALPTDDPLARRPSLTLQDLADRTCVRLPESADPTWRAFWQATSAGTDGPAARSLDECLHAVLWQRAVALVPGQALARHRVEGIVYRPVDGLPPSRLVLAWRRADRSPLIPAYAAAFCTATR
ncbi:DNA-binding transcriptional LysR family regulator [Streptomyces sp. 1114.5]|uniref:LysR family transcriptional regulator n=1 Tax=unclassified Streptomyces TaxID=2593676 RepID=UPI000BCFFFBA|nr:MULTISPECIES: LysR substrate-binding domain-containing protein [unclassified Streptomyces]RKT09758.1 DNA-binding transcriptional LysR family regulator [Streptomyces sp. 1114.5]SOB88892.1 DNA-binding transcriptional regulator, LysR family [Streptomyces sp. 1331.2]